LTFVTCVVDVFPIKDPECAASFH